MLSISVVTYAPEQTLLETTFSSLFTALGSVGEVLCSHRTILIDNSPHSPTWLAELADKYSASLNCGQGNVGFGRGHNLSFGKIGDYHLILNPDVELAPESLREALRFMATHPECGVLTPAVFWEDGSRQYLCKRYPSVLDLVLRGFAPKTIRRLFRKRLDRYEMRDVIGDEVVWDPPIVSGCFMLFRGDVFRKLGGFDPRFFLYFEDFDISLRTAEISRIAYVPSVKIVHHGGHAAKKGWKHIRMFVRSGIQFFNKHGWRWW